MSTQPYKTEPMPFANLLPARTTTPHASEAVRLSPELERARQIIAAAARRGPSAIRMGYALAFHSNDPAETAIRIIEQTCPAGR